MKRFFYFGMLITGMLLSCKSQHVELTQIEGQQLIIHDSIASNESLEEFIEPYRDHVSKEMNRVLSFAPYSMDKSQGELNTAIGNMMADAVMELAGPILESRTGEHLDVVLLNHGGIRSAISQGDITVGTAFQVMPFENEVVVAALTADGVRQLVDYLVEERVAHPIAGMQITIDEKKQEVEVLVDNKPLEEGRIYYVATNDYLFEGGDRMDFFNSSSQEIVLDYKIRNLLIDYFEQQDSIAPEIDNRFIMHP